MHEETTGAATEGNSSTSSTDSTFNQTVIGSTNNETQAAKVGLSFGEATGTIDDISGSNGFLDSLPEEYRGEKFLQNMNSVEDLVKEHANLQKLIGKKEVMKAPDMANETEWNEYISKIRPEAAEAYEFDDSMYPEGFERNQDEVNQVKQLMHKAGLTQDQARLIQSEYDKMTYVSPEQQAQNWNDTAVKLLGDSHQEIIDNASKFMDKVVPANIMKEFSGVVDSMSDQSLIMMASVVDAIKNKYESEGSMPHGGDNSNSVDMKAQRVALMNHPAYYDKFHPEYESVRKKYSSLL